MQSYLVENEWESQATGAGQSTSARICVRVCCSMLTIPEQDITICVTKQ